uniref:Uncharacterized protein n=1 Tax=Tanacetum cinerariifolium TaxID=118510 RepID=A0A6L2LAP6_TANCI|nr:hypothetical protein [Tanacetum cinerariifolium]
MVMRTTTTTSVANRNNNWVLVEMMCRGHDYARDNVIVGERPLARGYAKHDGQRADIVMSDLEDSTVTYTEVSSPFEDLLDIGSLVVVVYVYDGLPTHPPSPDYVPGPEYPPSPDYVPSPEHPPLPAYVPYVSKPAYPEFMPHEDDVLSAEEQPLPTAVSPATDSPGYVIEDDDDEEEDESFEDDANDEEEDEDEDEDEEEEH